MRLFILLYSSFHLVNSFTDINGNPTTIIENAESLYYEAHSLEKKVEFIRQWTDYFKASARNASENGLPFDVALANRDKYFSLGKRIRFEHMNFIITKFWVEYRDNDEIVNLMRQKRDDLGEKPRAYTPYLLKLIDTALDNEFTYFGYSFQQDRIEDELKFLSVRTVGTNLHQLVAANLADVKSMDVKEVFNHGLMAFRKAYEAEYKELKDVSSTYWHSSYDLVSDILSHLVKDYYEKKIAALSTEARKIYDEMKIFNEEYKKEMQQEIDAEIEALNTYNSLPIEGKVGYLNKDFDTLMDGVRFANQSAQDNGASILQDLKDDHYAVQQINVITLILRAFRARYGNHIPVKSIIDQRQQHLQKNMTRMKEDSWMYIPGIELLEGAKSTALNRKQTKIKNALKQLLKTSKDVRMKKTIESALAKVESLNLTDVFRPGQEVFERKKQALEQDTGRKMALVSAYVMNQEKSEYGQNLLAALNDEGKKNVEEITALGKEYKKNLQTEIDAIRETEKQDLESEEKDRMERTEVQ